MKSSYDWERIIFDGFLGPRDTVYKIKTTDDLHTMIDRTKAYLTEASTDKDKMNIRLVLSSLIKSELYVNETIEAIKPFDASKITRDNTAGDPYGDPVGDTKYFIAYARFFKGESALQQLLVPFKDKEVEFYNFFVDEFRQLKKRTKPDEKEARIDALFSAISKRALTQS